MINRVLLVNLMNCVFNSKLNMSIVILLLMLPILALGGIGIRYNHTESLPGKLYLSFPILEPKAGQIISFKLPMCDAVLAKMIVGLPGDIIDMKERTITVNGKDKGEIASGMEGIHPQVIPPGYYFVLGTHKESFDSRYEEFGLVPRESIREGLWAIY